MAWNSLERVGILNHDFQPPTANRLLNPEFWILAYMSKNGNHLVPAFLKNAPAILALREERR
jgi:hypothetical protein